MLTLKDTQSLVEKIEMILTEEGAATEISAGSYAKMQYPKWFPLFRFKVKEFFIPNFGNAMIMQTKAMGVMHLVTMAFTPNMGTNMPFLLIDCMSFRKKRTVFVEYYDCTIKKEEPEVLKNIAEKYAYLPEYPEKEAWYIPLRTSYSLIKGNTAKEELELIELILSEVCTYIKLSQERQEQNPENIRGLRAFRERMITEGNPSSQILSKVLGEEGAKEFYRAYIMPMKEKE